MYSSDEDINVNSIKEEPKSSSSDSEPPSPRPRNKSNFKASQNVESLARRNLDFSAFKNAALLTKYFDKRTHLSLESQSEQTNTSSPFDIDLDEEIFLVHCAQNVPIDKFVGKKIKFGKNTIISDENMIYECESNINSNEQYATLINCPGQRNKVISLPVMSVLKIHEKLAEPELSLTDEVNRIVSVPYPTNLKVRHPLHGWDYKKIIELPIEVKKRLQNAAIRPVAGDNNSTQKRQKRRDIKREVIVDGASEPQTKKSKRSKNAGIKTEKQESDDLDWINQI